MIDREKLRRLCEAATPGPWAYEDGSIVNREHEGDDWDIAEVYPQNRANAHLIAAARTALPALLDALEEQEAMTSALNGDVTELGQKLEAAEAREKNLLAAVKNIAKQRLHAEIADCDPDELDWLSGYEGCVKEARAAIAETAP